MTSNFSFSRSVFYMFLRTFCHLYQIWNCRLLTLSIWKSLKFVVWEWINSAPTVGISDSSNWKAWQFHHLLHRYLFWRINSRRLLKTLLEKEKLLLTSNFSFSNIVFPLNLTIVSPFVHIFNIISLFAAEFGELKIGLRGEVWLSFNLFPNDRY